MMSQYNENFRVLRRFRDQYHDAIIDELRHEFRDYRHFDVGFGALLKSLTYGIGEEVLQQEEFRREVKYELKLIMNYLHMVRDRNTLREIKTSAFPMLLLGAAGNRTAVKLVMIATYLSAKAMPFVIETYRVILATPGHQDPDFVAALYAKMLSDLRHLATREAFYKQRPQSALRDAKINALQRLRLRKKNEIRARLGLDYLRAHPDDPYRSLPISRVPHSL